MRGPAFRMSLALLAAVTVVGSAGAQAPAKPSKTQIDNAGRDLAILSAAMGSDKVPNPVKNALFQCLYQNTLAKISDGTTKALAASKLDRADPSKVLGVMAGVCGYRPGAAPAAKGN